MSALIRRHHILLLLALHGCAAEVPVYTPPPARPAEDLGMDNTSPNDAQQGRASGVRGMTYDELLACANDKAGITGQQKKLHTQLGGINALKNAIDAEGAAIETSRRLVDARSEKSVDTFNARIQQYQTTVRDLKTDVDAYNNSVSEANTAARAYGIACANRPFRESDREKLPAELRDLMAKDSEPFDLPTVFDDDKS